MASQINNGRIAKNTVFLYFRTIITLLISLYTSRVVLNQLGVADFGIYSVVGGVVSMFAVVSSAMSSSISRFVTYELGRKNSSNLSKIFSSSMNIQLLFAFLVLLLGETVGVWFVNHHLNIGNEKIYVANWIFQFSLVAFSIGILSVPYNASIIAHERMTVFAYISIMEAVLKLGACVVLIMFEGHKLQLYSVFMMLVALISIVVTGGYCIFHFKECRYHFCLDKELMKEMSGFAGWSFLNNTAWILNTQGVNVLINIFFGVTLNAARAIATQVESAIMQFVNSFTAALNPQITKSYAAGELDAMYLLICRSAKFSFFILLIPGLPIVLETEFILICWLKTVPDYTAAFVRLSIISVMINLIGNSSYTACSATANIKKYSIVTTLVGACVFPITWIFFKFGFSAIVSYVVFIIIYMIIDVVRVLFMKKLIKFPTTLFVSSVLKPILLTTLSASVLPLLAKVFLNLDGSCLQFVMIFLISLVTTIISIYLVGLSQNERCFFTNKLKIALNKVA